MRRGRIGGPGRHGNAGAFAVGMAVGGRRSRDHSPDHKLVKTAVVASAIRPGPRRPHPVAKAAVVGSVVGNSRRPGLTLMLIRPRPMVMRPRRVRWVPAMATFLLVKTVIDHNKVKKKQKMQLAEGATATTVAVVPDRTDSDGGLTVADENHFVCEPNEHTIKNLAELTEVNFEYKVNGQMQYKTCYADRQCTRCDQVFFCYDDPATAPTPPGPAPPGYPGANTNIPHTSNAPPQQQGYPPQQNYNPYGAPPQDAYGAPPQGQYEASPGSYGAPPGPYGAPPPGQYGQYCAPSPQGQYGYPPQQGQGYPPASNPAYEDASAPEAEDVPQQPPTSHPEYGEASAPVSEDGPKHPRAPEGEYGHTLPEGTVPTAPVDDAAGHAEVPVSELNEAVEQLSLGDEKAEKKEKHAEEEAVQKPKFCQECGHKLAGAKFCGECGHKA